MRESIAHFLGRTKAGSYAALCGIRNVEFATESKRGVKCKRCRRMLGLKDVRP